MPQGEGLLCERKESNNGVPATGTTTGERTLTVDGSDMVLSSLIVVGASPGELSDCRICAGGR